MLADFIANNRLRAHEGWGWPLLHNEMTESLMRSFPGSRDGVWWKKSSAVRESHCGGGIRPANRGV